MDVTPLIDKDRKVIQSYGAGGFTINSEEFAGSIFITPHLVKQWQFGEAGDISITSFSCLEEQFEDIEVLLIGSGATHIFLPLEIKQYFKNKNISVDLMSTGAACRTYNVLLSEDRKVAAALIAV